MSRNKVTLGNRIEAYCFPQGVISVLFREIAAGRPGLITTVGIDTFIAPRLEDGRMNERTTEDLIEVLTVQGREHLSSRPSRSTSRSCAGPPPTRRAT